jgi:uncharacterized repeat protein (TIGR01451 family)
MRKYLLLLCTQVLITTGFTQCSLDLFLQVLPPACADVPLESYVVLNDFNCPDAALTTYHWELIQDGQTLATADTFTPGYFGFILTNTGAFSVCLTVSVYDGLGNLLLSENECGTVVGFTGITLCELNADDPENCSSGGCAEVQICGGNPGYTLYLNGNGIELTQDNNIFSSCGLASGTYSIQVVDSNGCTASETLMIPYFNSDDTHGLLYFDSNNDGAFADVFLTEPLLANQAVHFVEPDITVYTDANGGFTLDNLPAGTYTVEWIDNSDVFDISPAFNSTVTVPSCIEIPLVSTDNTMLQVSGPCCIWMMDIHCTNGFNPGLYIENTGSVTINGSFTMTFDESLIPENLSGAIPYNDYIPGQLTWNIVNLIPGEMALYQCHILGPGTDQIGEVFPFNMDLELVNNDDELIYENSWILEPTVVCAYDPNDKYAEPAGYTEEHLITADQEIEYRIRFQNTGNFPAENIYIEDILDLNVLDLSTFYPVFGSHNFYTVVEDNGMVKFMFDNIFLPSMESDEPGSQGYVVFRIKPYASLEAWTQIHNTAQIYFDENPPIITNTYLHTIFECGNPAILPATDDQCAGLSYVIEPDMTYYENFNWYVDGEYYDNTPYFVYESAQEENLQVTLEMSNPICTGTNEMDLTIHDSPNGILTIDGNILTADADASTWYWYVNDVYVENVNTQTFTATVSGTYQVVAANEWFCNTTSNVVNFTSLDEFEGIAPLILYPNPIEEGSILFPGPGIHELYVYDGVGRLLHQKQVTTGDFAMTNLSLESGMYTFVVKGIEGTRMVKAVVEN